MRHGDLLAHAFAVHCSVMVEREGNALFVCVRQVDGGLGVVEADDEQEPRAFAAGGVDGNQVVFLCIADPRRELPHLPHGVR